MNKSIGDFDAFADNYEQKFQDALGVFAEESNYFARYKIDLLAHLVANTEIKSILDYGSGIGTSIPHLHDSFPNAQIWATDISLTSLHKLRQRFDYTETVTLSELPKQHFDLIFVSCVFHHIPEERQQEAMDSLFESLSPGGQLCIFEHNPYNPITRRIVSSCEFDEGVTLLKKSQLIKLSRESSHTGKTSSGYCLFFPSFLRKLLIFERKLRWLPLGGQYFVLISQQDNKTNFKNQ